MRRLATAAVLALSFALTPAPSFAPRIGSSEGPRWTAEDAASLDARIVEIETRLLEHQARVSFWQEMRARHQSVSAIACENLTQHAMALQASESRVRERSAAERKGRRVAAAALLGE